MSNLFAELLIRLGKAVVVAALALGLYLAVTVGSGEAGSVTLALLCWLSAAAFWLLVETSPL